MSAKLPGGSDVGKRKMFLSLMGAAFAAVMPFSCSLDSEADVDRADIFAATETGDGAGVVRN